MLLSAVLGAQEGQMPLPALVKPTQSQETDKRIAVGALASALREKSALLEVMETRHLYGYVGEGLHTCVENRRPVVCVLPAP